MDGKKPRNANECKLRPEMLRKSYIGAKKTDICSMKTKTLFAVFFLSLSTLTFASVYKSNVHASYYADKFHGKATASGEIFDMNDFTCAHKTLPFGTVLRVTNLANNRSVSVRVNDRGPFVAGREIDLSKAAARQLDMIRTGTANVKIEILSDAAASSSTITETPVTPNAVATPVVATTTEVRVKLEAAKAAFWDVQVGSFANHDNANALAQTLLKDGFENVYFQKTDDVTRVVIKKVPDAQLKETEAKLKANGFENYLVKKNN